MAPFFREYGFEFNNRELAGLIWIAVVLIIALLNPATRRAVGHSILRLVTTAFSQKLIVVWATYISWITIFVLIANEIGIWKPVLLKDTLAWTLTAGISTLISLREASKPHYLVTQVKRIAGILVLMEYFLNLTPFNIWIEIFLQPVILFIILAPKVAKGPIDQNLFKEWSTKFHIYFPLIIIAHTARMLYMTRDSIDWRLFVLQVSWPVGLAVWVLILVLALAVIDGYRLAFVRLNRLSRSGVAPWYSKLAIVLTAGLKMKLVRKASRGGTFPIARADSLRAAYRAAKAFIKEQETS